MTPASMTVPAAAGRAGTASADPLTDLTPEAAFDWLALGRLLVRLEADERAASGDDSPIEAVRQRLEALGRLLSPRDLRDHCRVFRFVRREAPDVDLDAPGSTSAFEAFAIAERIFELDPTAGRKALRLCLEGIRATPLKRLHAQVKLENLPPPPRRRLPRAGGAPVRRTTPETLRRRVLVELAADPGIWWDMPGARVRRIASTARLPPPLADLDGVFAVLGAAGARALGGVRLLAPGRSGGPEWGRALSEALTHASFLDRHWLLLRGPEPEARAFAAALEDLGAPNLGVVALPTEARPEGAVRLALGRGAPVPDRRDRLLNALLGLLAAG